MSLDQHVGRFPSRMGRAFVGTRAVFRGRDLHRDLKDLDWLELYLFGITGRRFAPEALRMFHALWVYTSYPDARIWNNRVAALAGSARSTGNLGMAAALAVSEATIYGRGIDVRAIDFFTRTQRALESGAALADCVQAELRERRGIAGYGRPIANGDERIAPLMALACRLDLADGPHVGLAFAVEHFLLEGRWRWRMNYGALAAAMAADLGLSTREYYLFSGPAFLAGMQPCFIEARERQEGTLFPLACEHVKYEGAKPRAWPGG